MIIIIIIMIIKNALQWKYIIDVVVVVSLLFSQKLTLLHQCDFNFPSWNELNVTFSHSSQFSSCLLGFHDLDFWSLTCLLCFILSFFSRCSHTCVFVHEINKVHSISIFTFILSPAWHILVCLPLVAFKGTALCHTHCYHANKLML